MLVNDVVFNGLYGMVLFMCMFIFMVECIEVFKGLGMLMYGMGLVGGVGGVVNLIFKCVYEDLIFSVMVIYFFNLQFGLKVDFGCCFGEQQEWGICVNVFYVDGNIGLFGSNQQQNMGLVGFDYNGGCVCWSLDVYIQYEDVCNFCL